MTKKVLAILLALAMVFSFAACGNNGGNDNPEKDPEPVAADKLVVKKGVTVPAFTVKINGVPITNDDMADYDVYEGSITSTNSSGTTSTVVFIGFKVTDMMKAAELTGTPGKLTATADDGYQVEWADGASENNMVAISKDGSQFKSYPWFIPCDSETTGDQLKGCAKIVIEGMTAPESRLADDEKKTEGGDVQLAAPDKQDKSDKVVFDAFSFKIDGKEIKNEDLAGLPIYKIAVQVLNKKGEVEDHSYTGYVMMDVFNKLGLNQSSIKAVCNDGYEAELGGGLVKNEYTLIAIECDKETGKDGTIWVAPCSSNESNAYVRLVVEIKTK